MFRKIDHIGIAVRDLDAANRMFGLLAGHSTLKIEEVPSEKVKVSFFLVGDVKIEFLMPTAPDSPIAKYIEKNGEGVHHIAFEVDDVGTELERLKNEGFELIHQQPKPGADGKMIAFLHPRSTGRVLTELCMDAPAS